MGQVKANGLQPGATDLVQEAVQDPRVSYLNFEKWMLPKLRLVKENAKELMVAALGILFAAALESATADTALLQERRPLAGGPLFRFYPPESTASVVDRAFAEIFEPSAPAATGQVFPTGEELRKEVDRYIMDNYKSFKLDYHNHIHPGDRVMERDSGRVGTVQCGGKDHITAHHPAVRYDDEPSVVSTEYNKDHFRVITDEKSLPRPPWVPEYGVPLGMMRLPVPHRLWAGGAGGRVPQLQRAQGHARDVL